MKKIMVAVLMSIGTLSFASCGKEENSAGQNSQKESSHHLEQPEGNNNSNIPKGLKTAQNPTYPVGSKAIITANHMEGMEGAEAKIVGAYDTTAYIVSYTPTDGSERVTDHKWVIHEEIDRAPDLPIERNSEVSLNAAHMPGMEGAVAVIEDFEETTVYMVDYTTRDGQVVRNHKWVTEEELKPVQ